jgi:hypothetical protein
MMLTVLLWNLQDCHRYESSIYARVLVLRALELRFGPVGGPSVRQNGQVLSLFAPLPGLWDFGRILIDHQVDIKDFIKRSPSFVAEGVCFIVTGRNEWSTTRETLDRDYFHWSRRRWLISKCQCPSRQAILIPFLNPSNLTVFFQQRSLAP